MKLKFLKDVPDWRENRFGTFRKDQVIGIAFEKAKELIAEGLAEKLDLKAVKKEKEKFIKKLENVIENGGK